MSTGPDVQALYLVNRDHDLLEMGFESFLKLFFGLEAGYSGSYFPVDKEQ